MTLGIIMFYPHPYVRYVACMIATSMHLFICVFGIGPYRWNVMSVYLIWSVHSLMNKNVS